MLKSPCPATTVTMQCDNHSGHRTVEDFEQSVNESTLSTVVVAACGFDMSSLTGFFNSLILLSYVLNYLLFVTLCWHWNFTTRKTEGTTNNVSADSAVTFQKSTLSKMISKAKQNSFSSCVPRWTAGRVEGTSSPRLLCSYLWQTPDGVHVCVIDSLVLWSWSQICGKFPSQDYIKWTSKVFFTRILARRARKLGNS